MGVLKAHVLLNHHAHHIQHVPFGVVFLMAEERRGLGAGQFLIDRRLANQLADSHLFTSFFLKSRSTASLRAGHCTR